MNLTFRKADAADLELLVKNRIEVLRAANGLCRLRRGEFLSGHADISQSDRTLCLYHEYVYAPRIPTQGDCFAYAGVSYERDPVAWNHESHIGSYGRGASSV